MASSTKVKWGSYREYEGPFYRGTQRYKEPEDPTFNQKILSVFTATEGGRYDAINMYDRCIVSVGLIQWCEAGQYSVSSMLGEAYDGLAPSMADGSPFAQHLEEIGYVFTKAIRGKWRFYRQTDKGLDEVDTKDEQRRLFLLHSTGKKSTWDNDSRAYAKKWAAVLATVFEDTAAKRAQLDYTAARLTRFVTAKARVIWEQAPETDWAQAAYCGFLSYAGNLPTTAAKHLAIHAKSSDKTPFEKDWVIEMFEQLTFGPGIAIYPHRYDAIRPHLERLFGIDLPDYAKELKKWEDKHGAAMDVEEVQQYLVDYGFDLGISGPNRDGVDGVYGIKTKNAVMTLQQAARIKPATGAVTPATAELLRSMREAEDRAITAGFPADLVPEMRKNINSMLMKWAKEPRDD